MKLPRMCNAQVALFAHDIEQGAGQSAGRADVQLHSRIIKENTEQTKRDETNEKFKVFSFVSSLFVCSVFSLISSLRASWL